MPPTGGIRTPRLWYRSHLIRLTNVRPLLYNRANDNERKIVDEFDFFMDEDEYAIEEAEEFEALIDHEAGFDCDPYDVESYYGEAMLAYYD